MLKNVVFFLALLIASRFIGLPTNFTPLLALAVFMPRLTDDKLIQHLLPVCIIAFTNLFLQPVNSIVFFTMLMVFAVTPYISRKSDSLLWGSFVRSIDLACNSQWSRMVIERRISFEHFDCSDTL
jgi:hypothetical protein